MTEGKRPSDVLEAGRLHADMSVDQLWLAYAVLGGTASQAAVVDILAGTTQPSTHDYNVLAQALNDAFTDEGRNHPVPYAEDVD